MENTTVSAPCTANSADGCPRLAMATWRGIVGRGECDVGTLVSENNLSENRTNSNIEGGSKIDVRE
jgi:hypothetical protein